MGFVYIAISDIPDVLSCIPLDPIYGVLEKYF